MEIFTQSVITNKANSSFSRIPDATNGQSLIISLTSWAKSFLMMAGHHRPTPLKLTSWRRMVKTVKTSTWNSIKIPNLQDPFVKLLNPVNPVIRKDLKLREIWDIFFWRYIGILFGGFGWGDISDAVIRPEAFAAMSWTFSASNPSYLMKDFDSSSVSSGYTRACMAQASLTCSCQALSYPLLLDSTEWLAQARQPTSASHWACRNKLYCLPPRHQKGERPAGKGHQHRPQELCGRRFLCRSWKRPRRQSISKIICGELDWIGHSHQHERLVEGRSWYRTWRIIPISKYSYS